MKEKLRGDGFQLEHKRRSTAGWESQLYFGSPPLSADVCLLDADQSIFPAFSFVYAMHDLFQLFCNWNRSNCCGMTLIHYHSCLDHHNIIFGTTIIIVIIFSITTIDITLPMVIIMIFGSIDTTIIITIIIRIIILITVIL